MTRHAMLEPFRPTAANPFDAVKAAHLYNRAGFGGTEEEIAAAVKAGPAATLAKLMSFPDASAAEQTKELPTFKSIDGYPQDLRELRQSLVGKSEQERKEVLQKLLIANREALGEVVFWWLERMAHGPYPMQEKLTLFWHGHFTTSAKDERNALLMWRQNELLRQMAAGNFAAQVRAISRDPAMLDYLNNQQNRKQHPNENYARELMELFTLGIGNYGEEDVKEAARAFTGWGHDGADFVFRRGEHDLGTKTFLGRRGNFDGDDVITIILQQPACAPFIARELFEFFAYEEPEDALVASLGQTLRESEYNLRPVLKTIFTSRAFYSARSIGSQIKSPLQLVVGTVRLLGEEIPRDRRLIGALAQMGQIPLAPPNVKGWPGGRMWINTSTLFVRQSTLLWLAGGQAPQVGGGGLAGLGGIAAGLKPSAISPLLPIQRGSSAGAVVDYWLNRLIQRPVPDEKKQLLMDAMGPKTEDEQTIRRLVQLILTMPEYELC